MRPGCSRRLFELGIHKIAPAAEGKIADLKRLPSQRTA
jgi:hypothetical protein